MIIIFSDIKSADAIGMSPPLQPRVVRVMSNQNNDRLIQPSKVKLDLEIKPKIIMRSLNKNVQISLIYIQNVNFASYCTHARCGFCMILCDFVDDFMSFLHDFIRFVYDFIWCC